jgi:hypothetical protein
MGKRGEARLGYEHDRDVAFVAGVLNAIGPKAIGLGVEVVESVLEK